MSGMHLSDDRIVELCLDAHSSPDDRAHLAACPVCEGRHALLAGTLREVSTVMVAEADAAFPRERLDRQRARILQRVDQAGRPARLISFPHAQPAEPAAPRARRRVRWAGVAAVVVVSFVGGQIAEHRWHDGPARQAVPPASAGPSGGGDVRVALTDDEFFGQIELAGGRGGPAALQPLDILTPRTWDVR